MSDSHVKLYNSLPSIKDAHDAFASDAEIISQLWPVLRKYEGKFGVCLVHRHCSLLDGERMVADGVVTEPMITDQCHPLSWLKTGEPFEFSSEPTERPPDSLFADFRDIVGAISVLGIFYVPEEDRKHPRYGVEHTRGRKNIIRYDDVIPTAWRLSGDRFGPLGNCTDCTGPSHPIKIIPTKIIPPPRSLIFPSGHTNAWRNEISPLALDLISMSLDAVKHCATLVPRMCMMLIQFNEVCTGQNQPRTQASATVQVDDSCVKETQSFLQSVTDISEEIDNLYTSSNSLASIVKRCKSRGICSSELEAKGFMAQLHLLRAQTDAIVKEISVIANLMNDLPRADSPAPRLRDWAELFAQISNQVQVIDISSSGVLEIATHLVEDGIEPVNTNHASAEH
ncbi:hypothetical protein R3P38DRAFT_185475 [Favolaschia claudopus]|uniref:Uncharacterized protein n=1 Tax=Favolaschia claudopus TaxID=2862362 RepID=A0AAW0D260_9AGAR